MYTGRYFGHRDEPCSEHLLNENLHEHLCRDKVTETVVVVRGTRVPPRQRCL